MSVEGWEFQEELARLQEEPHTMRRWTSEEAALADISSELQRQHDVLQELLRLPSVVAALWWQERLDAYERDGFDWSGVRIGRSFRHLSSKDMWSVYTIHRVYLGKNDIPVQVRAWNKNGASLTDRQFSAEAFAVGFDGWKGEGGQERENLED